MEIRPAQPSEFLAVAAVLGEAAAWLRQTGRELWLAEEVAPAKVAPDVLAGLFYVVAQEEEITAVAKIQFDDPLFWPDVPPNSSLFLHRIAVRRAFAGQGMVGALLAFARQMAVVNGRSYVRLDCDAARPALRRYYERLGFGHHSDRQVGPWWVARYELSVANAE